MVKENGREQDSKVTFPRPFGSETNSSWPADEETNWIILLPIDNEEYSACFIAFDTAA